MPLLDQAKRGIQTRPVPTWHKRLTEMGFTMQSQPAYPGYSTFVRHGTGETQPRTISVKVTCGCGRFNYVLDGGTAVSTDTVGLMRIINSL